MVEPTFRSPDAARAAATPMGSAPAPATAGQEISLDVFAKDVANGSDAARLALAQQLKNAGLWTGKISSKFDIKYYGALVKLEERYQGQIALDRLIGAKTTTTRYDVLTSILTDEETGGSGGGPTTVTNVTKYKPEAARQLVDSIIKDTLGRKATAAEIKKYSEMLKSIEGKAATTTTYGTGSKQTQTTMAGLNEQQYLIDKISGTDEGKANKVLGFYETFMNALGGGR
jgi:hypothetical protein